MAKKENTQPHVAELSAHKNSIAATTAITLAHCELSRMDGRLPSRLNTLKSEVLASLLRGNRTSAMDAVIEASTTRLAAVIHSLREDGWNIQSAPFAAACADGRVSHPSIYWMEPGEIIKAGPSAAAWRRAVAQARRDLRAKAARAQREADRQNAMRRISLVHPAQLAFDLGGV